MGGPQLRASEYPGGCSTVTGMARRLIVLIATLALVAAACTSDDEGAPDSGGDHEIAPEFAVETFDGTEWSLSGHIANDGRPVFLNLWASWCYPCREEMPAIDEASKLHPDVAFVGIAVQDTESDARSFSEEIAVSYPLAFDEGPVEDAYNPLGLPASYIISEDGVILEQIFGKVTQEDLTEKFAEHFG